MSKLANKVAIVTGASKGIGAAIAKAYGKEGASVVVNYSSDKAGAERVVADIDKAGGKAIAVQANVAVAADVKKLFAATKTAYNKLDILVNNAGVFKFEPLETVTEEEFHRQFNTNVLGTILATQEALQYFNGDGGSVINVGSVVSDNPLANSVVYSATKGAVDTIAVALSKELGAKNVRVNTIAPGAVDTEGTQSVGIIGSDFEKQIVASTPLGRIGQPDDIAKVAVFLGSSDAGWINGQKVTVSGGQR
ncbi:MAG TPA: glucose 1-dehydrogenase [Chitinophagaceae bacterium]|nr:glucose 1-dehydrogenase [Chitinophagaceae bacterium]